MQTLVPDLRYAVRLLWKQPGFSLIVIATLALGIGANTAIFSVINAVLLKPLPYAQPEQLLTTRGNQSVPDLRDLQDWSQSYANVGGINQQPLDYTGGSEPQQLLVGHVTGGFFDTLGIAARLGRTLNHDDDKPGGAMIAVLSDALWQLLFQRDPNVIGKTLPLSGNSFTVVGVMPAGFKAPRDNSQLWVPIHVTNAAAAAYRGVHFLHAYFRLKPGVTLQQAATEMQVLDKRLAELYPAENKNRRTVLMPLLERVVGNTTTTLWVLFGAVGLVLLIACANYANLLLVRGAARQQEMTVRVALGAGSGRIVRQILTESVLLSLLGGVIGLLFAQWGVDLLVALKPENLPRLETISLDARVLGFALLVALLTGIVFGLVPALSAVRTNVSEALKEGERGGVSATRHRLRSGLIVVEMAMAFLLLVGAGLLLKSFWHLRTVQPGFNPDKLVTMRIDLPEKRYKEMAKQTQYRQSLLAEVNALPNVQAALVSELPLSGDSLNHDFTREGWALPTGEEPSVETRSIEGAYFQTMQIPLLAGRDFTVHDNADAPLVGIVNEALVKAHFANENPLGKRVRWARDDEIHWITIVGVVSDVRHFGLDAPEAPALYTPYPQSGREWKRWMTVVIRGEQTPAALTAAAKTAIWKVDAQLPITKVLTMSEVMAESFAERRFNMLLLCLFAALALTLAGVGIYGVIAHAVAQRTHEIGIRMALGARNRDVLRLVLGQGLRLALLGAVLGSLAAWGMTRWMKSMLYGLTPTDPLTFVSVAAALLTVALLACWIPARRATKIDPMIALRYE
ncbi:MAG TPA: ABC transporter permease [Blastocatellia bacterium]|nr:ABC transporter permease [Blastocatellia bacterium]